MSLDQNKNIDTHESNNVMSELKFDLMRLQNLVKNVEESLTILDQKVEDLDGWRTNEVPDYHMWKLLAYLEVHSTQILEEISEKTKAGNVEKEKYIAALAKIKNELITIEKNPKVQDILNILHKEQADVYRSEDATYVSELATTSLPDMYDKIPLLSWIYRLIAEKAELSRDFTT